LEITMSRCIAVLLACLSLHSTLAQEPPSLAKVFEDQFRFGFGGTNDRIVRQGLAQPDSPIRRIVEHHSNIIGINCFYAATIRPDAKTWKWDNCEQLLGFADQHPDWPRRAHVAFWPFQSKPGLNLEWLIKDEAGQPVARDEAINRLREHIHAVIGRYKGRFQYWDVVNEVIDPQQPDGLRKGLWKDVVGPEVIDIAFQAAREADPAAKLFYNDFNEWVPAKRELIFKLVKGLKDKGLVDGIGLQAHYNMQSPTPRELDAAIARYAELGLEIHITELDVEVNKDGKLTEFTPALAEAQAKRYREIFDVYLKHAGKITAVMTWNVTDNSSWLRNHPTPHATWPLLFDAEGQPKPAFWRLVKPVAQ
jgi:endo-1,4-beta-xylanase